MLLKRMSAGSKIARRLQALSNRGGDGKFPREGMCASSRSCSRAAKRSARWSSGSLDVRTWLRGVTECALRPLRALRGVRALRTDGDRSPSVRGLFIFKVYTGGKGSSFFIIPTYQYLPIFPTN